MTSRVEELQRMCDSINENGGLNSGKWHTALLAQIAQNLAVIADVMLADRKIEPIPHDDYIETENDHLEARCLNCNNAKACKEKHWKGCVYEPKDEKTCETCKHNKLEWYSEICDSCCGNNNHYEPKTEPQTDIHDLTDCDFCRDRNCKDCEGGKDEPQTERSK